MSFTKSKHVKALWIPWKEGNNHNSFTRNPSTHLIMLTFLNSMYASATT